MTENEYDARPGIRSTVLRKVIDAATPAHYHRDEDLGRKDTDAFRLGRAVDIAVLEPHTFDARVLEGPEQPTADEFGFADFRSKAAQAMRDARLAEIADWRKQHGDKEILSASEIATVRDMAAAVRSKAPARKLLEAPGVAQLSLFWVDRDTQLECKARLDWFVGIDGHAYVVDLKTIGEDASDDTLARHAERYGYFTQAAFYLRGMRALYPGTEPRFLWIYAEKAPPHFVRVVEAHPEDLDLADVQVGDALRDIAAAKRDRTWRAYADTIETIRRPAWVRRQIKGDESWGAR